MKEPMKGWSQDGQSNSAKKERRCGGPRVRRFAKLFAVNT